MLTMIPVTFKAANAFVKEHHRHHSAVVGCKFVLACGVGEVVLGVAIAGRPVARMLDDGKTLEVTRVCVLAGVSNANSFLYGACARIARDMGYRRIITYTLATESGSSLKGSGWQDGGTAGGGSWSHPSRERVDKHPLDVKKKWIKQL